MDILGDVAIEMRHATTVLSLEYGTLTRLLPFDSLGFSTL